MLVLDISELSLALLQFADLCPELSALRVPPDFRLLAPRLLLENLLGLLLGAQSRCLHELGKLLAIGLRQLSAALPRTPLNLRLSEDAVHALLGAALS